MDIFNLFRTFFTSAGPGGVVVLTVFGLACWIYIMLTRWILRGGADEGSGMEG